METRDILPGRTKVSDLTSETVQNPMSRSSRRSFYCFSPPYQSNYENPTHCPDIMPLNAVSKFCLPHNFTPPMYTPLLSLTIFRILHPSHSLNPRLDLTIRSNQFSYTIVSKPPS